MWTWGKFFGGIIAAGIGFLMIWKADWLYRNFGSIPFAEKYIHSEGGTRTFYKLLGLLIMILALMEAAGLLEPLMQGLAEKYFGQKT